MKTLFSLILFSTLFSTFVYAQNAKLSEKDLKTIEGGRWQGTLTYLDYRSNKPVSIKSNLSVSQRSNGVWEFSYEYPDEPKANSKAEEKLEANGTQFYGGSVVEREKMSDGSLKFVVEKKGTDNNKDATFRYTFLISRSSFSVKKEVRLDGNEQYFERNTYKWTR